MTAVGSSKDRAAADPFTAVLDSMEQSLSVDLIATRPMVTCNCDDSAQEVLRRPGFNGIDQIPVRREGSVIGVLERAVSEGECCRSGECMRTLDERMLVASTTGILSYVHLAAGSPYHLVLKHGTIDGIVTPSDLLKLPVRLVLFAYLTHFEATMARVIRARCPDESWQDRLKPTRLKRAEGEFEEGCKTNVYAERLYYTQWCDKRDILAAVLPESVRGSKTGFVDDCDQLEDLRNCVMHTNQYLPDALQLSSLVRLAETRIHQMESSLQA